jgi:hypothetical protein
MMIFQSLLTVTARGLALQLFVPVLAAGILYFAGLPLPAFIVFQFFIEGFALWQLAIGLTLFTPGAGVSKRWFVFNMVFAMLYRLTTNGYQIYFYLQHGKFMAMEELLWLAPIHLYASVGVVYCFYINGLLIRKKEEKIGRAVFTVKQNFFSLLLFPWGLWHVQPRLNQLTH